MDFGRRWGNLRQIRFGRGEALLTLELPLEYAADLEMFSLHPALLDMATGGVQALFPVSMRPRTSTFRSRTCG